MSKDPGSKEGRPYSPAPESNDSRRGREVFGPVDGPFEAPAKEFVPGPYYMDVDEVMPELSERGSDRGGDSSSQNSPKGRDRFPLDRRDFLKLFSASSVAASTACVRRPVEKAIPYVQQPVDQVPGVPTYYATTCGDCAAGCGVMVKVREGRPVKLEGLPDHPVSNGRLCGIGQSNIQGLFHPERLSGPMIRFGNRLDEVDWKSVFEHLGARLKKTTRIGIFTNGATGHRHIFMKEWLEQMGSSAERLYTYESNTLYETITAAHTLAYGTQKMMPRMDLQYAKYIVGIGSDFLDVGTSPVYHTKTYTESHAFQDGLMGKHVQFESCLTMTGARSDERHVIPPGSETLVTLLLVRSLLETAGSKGSSEARAEIKSTLDANSRLLADGYKKVGIERRVFDELAVDLLATDSVVLCGGSYNFDENSTNLQLAAIMANELLGAYEKILRLERGWTVSPVEPGDLERFMNDAADLDVLLVIDSNPAFTLPQSWGVNEILKKIPTVVSVQVFPSEVDAFASYILPNRHYLESWGDEQPAAGFWSSRQPAVRPTTNSMQAEDILLWLAAAVEKPIPYSDYRAYLAEKWRAVYQLVQPQSDYDTFYKTFLHRGFSMKMQTQALAPLGGIKAAFKYQGGELGGLRLIAPLDSRLQDGRHAHKPVLQEAGDPLTTIAWDTYCAISPETAKKLGLRRNDVVKVQGLAGTFEVAIFPLPGLHPDAVMVPRGNGHGEEAGRVAGGVGVNPLVALAKSKDLVTGVPVTAGQPVKLVSTGARYALAAMQKHNDIANRQDIVKKVSLEEAKRNLDKVVDLDTVPDLFPALPKAEYRWGMSIDLTKCTGCNACVVACFIENNVPQVGRDQVLMGREMHWLHMDRYFYGPVENPRVTFQPMLCQQCNHAPCEAVCPVFATTHDPEGINAMTYNRCIGTRYCANACPYKVRRFNWWTHKWNVMGDRPQDRNPRALNPDVTVRTRGVMEKCTFCYQRLRDAKHAAKLRGTPLVDGEAKTACQQTCAAEAIVFGNLHDPASKVAKLRRDSRAYLALNGDPEHGHYGLKTLPNVSYLSQVTHDEPEGSAVSGGSKKSEEHG